MKKTIFVLLCVFALQIVYSQEYEYVPFPTSDAIWSEEYVPNESDCCINNGLDCSNCHSIYERFALNGEDTIMNDVHYKKLYLFHNSYFDKSEAPCIGGIREDENKRVYFKGETVLHYQKPAYDEYKDIEGEIMLYDFSLSVGDTIKDGHIYWIHMIVDRIDTVQIGDKLRKKIYLNGGREWIEGIGNLQGLLYTSGPVSTGGSNGSLICFIQNDEVLHFDDSYPDCFPSLSSIQSLEDDQGITIYTDPVKHNVKFNFGEYSIKSIQILNCSGLLYGYFDIQLQPEFLLSTEKYQSGIYIYMATDKNGRTHAGKFIVR